MTGEQLMIYCQHQLICIAEGWNKMLPAAYMEGEGSTLIINLFIPVDCSVALISLLVEMEIKKGDKIYKWQWLTVKHKLESWSIKIWEILKLAVDIVYKTALAGDWAMCV